MDHDYSRFERVSVVFEKRPDGGLRVSSTDVPGFNLSHCSPELVAADVIPALETIISDIIGKPVRVSMTGPSLHLPESPANPIAVDYVTKFAA